jgi:hypothetical protein
VGIRPWKAGAEDNRRRAWRCKWLESETYQADADRLMGHFVGLLGHG